jgi:glycine betaine/choline ABC-type transport system substrate-binding protein
VLGHVLAQLLEQECGVEARVGFAGHEPNHQALLDGAIDLYADYLGTALRRYLGLKPRRTAAGTYRAVRDEARRRWDIEWLPAFGFNNTYAVIVHGELARTLGLRTVSDLAPHAARLRLGGTAQLLASDPGLTFAPGGLGGFSEAYGLTFARTLELPQAYGATFGALGAGEADVIIDFPVNPRMVSLDLRELRDDRSYFAPYFAAPVVRGSFLRAHPSAREAIQRLAGRLDNRRAAEMNHAVEMQGRAAEAVAADLLRELTAGVTYANGGRSSRPGPATPA